MAYILLADDNIEQVTVQGKLLEMMGHEVGVAMSTEETLHALEQRRPDLVILDLNFPKVTNGLEAIRGIQGRAPVIVLSGWPDDLYGTPEERMVSRVVVKGSTRELLNTIAELLGANGRAAQAGSH